MEITERFTYLLDKHLKGTLSFEEKAEFFELVSTGDFDAIMGTHFEKTIQETGDDDLEHLPFGSDRLILNNIVNSEKTVPFTLKNKKNWIMGWRLVAAALVGFFTSLALYIYTKSDDSHKFSSEFIKNSQARINKSNSVSTANYNR